MHCRKNGNQSFVSDWYAQEISRKDLVNYKKYQGVSLTDHGKIAAKNDC
jgi:Mn-dependent DtxR family transcriptional regulator